MADYNNNDLKLEIKKILCPNISYYPNINELPYDLGFLELSLKSSLCFNLCLIGRAIITENKTLLPFYTIDPINGEYIFDIENLCMDMGKLPIYFNAQFLDKDEKPWRNTGKITIGPLPKYSKGNKEIKHIFISNEEEDAITSLKIFLKYE